MMRKMRQIWRDRNMDSKIDVAGLFLLVILSLGYLVFWNSFAKIYVQFPGVNFPVFIGEMFLILCGGLLALKWFFAPPPASRWYAVLGIYMIWLLVKATEGYFSYGRNPLALRHAALFYYPLFAIMSFHFLRKDLFSSKHAAWILLVLLIIKGTINFNDCFFVPIVGIFVFLALNLQNHMIKWLVLGSLFFIFPANTLFQYTRSSMISNIAALMFLAVYGFLSLKVSVRKKAVIVVGFIGISAFGIFMFADKSQLTSITTPKAVMETFRGYDNYINSRKSDYQPSDLGTQFYNKDRGKPKEIVTRLSFFAQGKDFGKYEDTKDALDYAEYILSLELLSMKPEIENISGHQVELGMIDQANADSKGGLLHEESASHPENARVDRVHKEWIRGNEMLKKLESTRAQMKGQSLATSDVSSSNVSAIDEHRALANEVVKFLQERDAEKLDRGPADETQTSSSERILERYLNNAAAEGGRNLSTQYGNIVFRLLIWRDMIDELIQSKPFLGFSFGKPQRSISLEITKIAIGEWSRDGWIAPHNGYLHMIYRAGVVGLALIVFMGGFFYSIVRHFLIKRNRAMGFLLAGLVYWMVLANFIMVFEFPYQAIPFWVLFGMVVSYREQTRQEQGQ